MFELDKKTTTVTLFASSIGQLWLMTKKKKTVQILIKSLIVHPWCYLSWWLYKLGGKVVDFRNVAKKGKSEYRFVKVSVIHSRKETVQIPCRATIEVRVESALCRTHWAFTAFLCFWWMYCVKHSEGRQTQSPPHTHPHSSQSVRQKQMQVDKQHNCRYKHTSHAGTQINYRASNLTH